MRAPHAGFVVLLPLLLLVTACDKPVAIGESNDLVVGVPDPLWSAIADDVERSLAPPVFSVRDEEIFALTPIDPGSADWFDFRNIRRVLVIGEPADPWMAEALDRVDGGAPTPPAVAEARNVWAQGQSVTLVVVPPGSPPDAAEPLLREAGERLVNAYDDYSRGRMYVTGADSAAADSLLEADGFALVPPRVYRIASPAPGRVIFRNDNPDPSELIREIDVAWRPAREVSFTPEAALEWRAELATEVTEPPQVTDEQEVRSRRLELRDREIIEVQGIWSNPPDHWPAAGPFVTWMVRCPERVYLLNGWVYAPGRPKYEYLVQLRTLLSTFRCER